MPPALEKFAKAVKLGNEGPALLQAFNPRNNPFVSSNAQYWFERELLYYVAYDFDVEELRLRKSKLLLAVGEDSNKEAAQYRTDVVLSEKLGLDIVHLPGAHLGFASHPEQFAQRLIEALEKRDQYYAKA